MSLNASNLTILNASNSKILLENLTTNYKDNKNNFFKERISIFKNSKSISDVLDKTFGFSSNKRIFHLNPIPKDSLNSFKYFILKNKDLIESFSTFDEIYELLSTATIPNIDVVTIYETSLNLGAYLGTMPTKVYLQSGSLNGAFHLFKLLNFYDKISSEESVSKKRVYKKTVLKLNELPDIFSELTPAEINNFLCSYKLVFEGISLYFVKFKDDSIKDKLYYIKIDKANSRKDTVKLKKILVTYKKYTINNEN